MVDFGESFGKNIGNIQYALDKLPTGHYNEVTEWLLWRDDMARDTKNRIIETALALFSQSGYLATSMNDIAQQVGLTKAALYKHFSGKQEILDCIVAQMERMDLERAQEYEMPETEPDGFAEAYQHIPVEQIYAYSLAQFRHWTEEEFPARFRRMLTLAVPRPGNGAAVSRLPRRRPGGVYGGDLSEDGGLGRTGNAARAAVLWTDVSAVQRV